MIGIVGGAGPFAGSELFKKIIEETNALSDQQHLPVVLYSRPDMIPDRTEYLEGQAKDNPGLPISAIFLQLESFGVTVAAIPCNTAHAPVIFDDIKRYLESRNSRLQVVSIISETVRHIKNNFEKGDSIGVLSTTGTWKEKIYRTPLEESGFHVLDAENRQEQNRIHEAIYNREYGVKAFSSPVTDKARDVLLYAAKGLINRGAQAVILGCTEMPIAITESALDRTPMIDTLKILARGLIRQYHPEKLKDIKSK